MLNDNTKRTRIIRAALNLAEGSSWRALSLADIAAEAGVSIGDIRRDFASKSGILRAFTLEVDRVVLRQSEPDKHEPATDRLFDVLMTRFEVMAPFKNSLRMIARDLARTPASALAQGAPMLTSLYWMLSAADIDAESPLGAVRVLGLAGLYARVLYVWFDDDDAGSARTMAALDKELRRGARAIGGIEAACSALLRFGRGFQRTANSARPGRSTAADKTRDFRGARDGSEEPAPDPSSTGPGPTAAQPLYRPNGSNKH